MQFGIAMKLHTFSLHIHFSLKILKSRAFLILSFPFNRNKMTRVLTPFYFLHSHFIHKSIRVQMADGKRSPVFPLTLLLYFRILKSHTCL